MIESKSSKTKEKSLVEKYVVAEKSESGKSRPIKLLETYECDMEANIIMLWKFLWQDHPDLSDRKSAATLANEGIKYTV